jgi:hypothetical protein
MRTSSDWAGKFTTGSEDQAVFEATLVSDLTTAIETLAEAVKRLDALLVEKNAEIERLQNPPPEPPWAAHPTGGAV